MSNAKKLTAREEYEKILTENGMTRTKAKLALLDELKSAKHPVSITELHLMVGEKKCHLSTVFRAIQQFKAKNIVRELSLGEDFYRYELNTNDDKDHVRCRNCGIFEKIEKISIINFEEITSKIGFKAVAYRLDLSGLCNDCSK